MADARSLRSTPPPRGELFTDPGADVVWLAIGGLSERGKHELRDRLIAEAAVPEARGSDEQVRLARAIAALRDAHELATLEAGGRGGGGTPRRAPATGDDADERPEVHLGVDTYDRLRGQQHRRSAWPPSTSIRRWFGGSWNEALRAAGLEPVHDGDALVAEIGSRFTREEVLACVRAYAQEKQVALPTMRGVIAWAKSPEVKRRPGRRPESQGPYDRLFPRGWQEVLIAGEFIEAPPEWEPGRHTGGAVGHRSRSAYGYTDAQIHGALREIAQRLGRSPMTTEYVAERDELLAEEQEQGLLPRPFPSLGVIQNRYATWDEALIAAGLEPTNGRHNKHGCGKRRSGRRVSDEEIIAAIRGAFTELGNPFTSTAYTRWRTEQIEKDKEARRYRRIPGYCAIWARYGTWANACTVALANWTPGKAA